MGTRTDLKDHEYVIATIPPLKLGSEKVSVVTATVLRRKSVGFSPTLSLCVFYICLYPSNEIRNKLINKTKDLFGYQDSKSHLLG